MYGCIKIKIKIKIRMEIISTYLVLQCIQNATVKLKMETEAFNANI